jgi:hypothetical protein
MNAGNDDLPAVGTELDVVHRTSMKPDLKMPGVMPQDRRQTKTVHLLPLGLRLVHPQALHHPGKRGRQFALIHHDHVSLENVADQR